MMNRLRSALPFVTLAAGAGTCAGYYYHSVQTPVSTLQRRKTVPHTTPFAKQYPQMLKELEILLEQRVSTSNDELEFHSRELSGYLKPSQPQAVVYPESTEEVSKIIKLCKKYEVPVVPFAAGTSLEGHIIASEGGITMSMRRMDKVLKVNKDDMDCVVQPGVGWMELNTHLEENGFNMFLGVDPAPGACIGGMCGTNCSGTNAVRYGTMKDQVVNLVVVMADGSIVKTGQRARKSSAGYDLARLIVGSEGTLGIVTEATLKLRNTPSFQRVARVSYDDVDSASQSVIKIMQKGIQLGAIEMLDEHMVRAVNKYMNMTIPETPCILFKFAGEEEHVKHDIKVVQNILKDYTKYEYDFTETKEATDRLWQARKHSFWAAETYVPGKSLMATDVAVPISRLAECITETKAECDASFINCYLVGHVGDGNFHVVIMFDPNDPKEKDEAYRLNANMVNRAIEMEGTCTGEHGIGIGKKKYLEKEMGIEAVELMKLLKRSLDPQNILNPGKIVDV